VGTAKTQKNLNDKNFGVFKFYKCRKLKLQSAKTQKNAVKENKNKIPIIFLKFVQLDTYHDY